MKYNGEQERQAIMQAFRVFSSIMGYKSIFQMCNENGIYYKEFHRKVSRTAVEHSYLNEQIQKVDKRFHLEKLVCKFQISRKDER